MKRAEGIISISHRHTQTHTERKKLERGHALALVRRVGADRVMAYEFGLAAGRDLFTWDAQAARTHGRGVADGTRSPSEALSPGVVSFLTRISGLQIPCGTVGAEWAGRQEEEGRGWRVHPNDVLKTLSDSMAYFRL